LRIARIESVGVDVAEDMATAELRVTSAAPPAPAMAQPLVPRAGRRVVHPRIASARNGVERMTVTTPGEAADALRARIPPDEPVQLGIADLLPGVAAEQHHAEIAALLVACRPGNAVDRGAVDNRRDLRDRAGGIAADVGHLDPLERNVSAADVLPKLHRLRAEDDV